MFSKITPLGHDASPMKLLQKITLPRKTYTYIEISLLQPVYLLQDVGHSTGVPLFMPNLTLNLDVLMGKEFILLMVIQ